MKKRILKDPETGEIVGATNRPFDQVQSLKSGGGISTNVAGAKFREYKVEWIAEGGCGTILLGSAGIPVKKMEAIINQHASDGWQLVFQVVENKRFLLFWKREAIILTFGR